MNEKTIICFLVVALVVLVVYGMAKSIKANMYEKDSDEWSRRYLDKCREHSILAEDLRIARKIIDESSLKIVRRDEEIETLKGDITALSRAVSDLDLQIDKLIQVQS